MQSAVPCAAGHTLLQAPQLVMSVPPLTSQPSSGSAVAVDVRFDAVRDDAFAARAVRHCVLEGAVGAALPAVVRVGLQVHFAAVFGVEIAVGAPFHANHDAAVVEPADVADAVLALVANAPRRTLRTASAAVDVALVAVEHEIVAGGSRAGPVFATDIAVAVLAAAAERARRAGFASRAAAIHVALVAAHDFVGAAGVLTEALDALPLEAIGRLGAALAERAGVAFSAAIDVGLALVENLIAAMVRELRAGVLAGEVEVRGSAGGRDRAQDEEQGQHAVQPAHQR